MTQQLKAVVADDHPIVSLGLSSIIKQSGIASFEGAAASADGLFNILTDSFANVVFLDLHIPGSDFESNIKHIKSHFPNCKIIVYSTFSSKDLLKKLDKLKVDGYLSKSASKEMITSCLQTISKGEKFYEPKLIPTKEQPSKVYFSKEKKAFEKQLSLSAREKQILKLICKGLTSQKIADELYLSKYTIETHRKNILRKLDFSSSAELVRFAVQQGLV